MEKIKIDRLYNIGYIRIMFNKNERQKCKR